jgi:hypothetical protein
LSERKTQRAIFLSPKLCVGKESSHRQTNKKSKLVMGPDLEVSVVPVDFQDKAIPCT